MQKFNDRLVSLVQSRSEAVAGLSKISQRDLFALAASPDAAKLAKDRAATLEASLVKFAKVRAELVSMLEHKEARGAVVALYTGTGEPALNPLNGINSWSVRDILAQMTNSDNKALRYTAVRK